MGSFDARELPRADAYVGAASCYSTPVGQSQFDVKGKASQRERSMTPHAHFHIAEGDQIVETLTVGLRVADGVDQSKRRDIGTR